jgi:hypothetical protein
MFVNNWRLLTLDGDGRPLPATGFDYWELNLGAFKLYVGIDLCPSAYGKWRWVAHRNGTGFWSGEAIDSLEEAQKAALQWAADNFEKVSREVHDEGIRLLAHLHANVKPYRHRTRVKR